MPSNTSRIIGMSTYQERMAEESEQLEDRLVKLNAFIRSDAYEQLDAVDQLLLRLQASAMAQYTAILEQRIARSQ